MACKASNGFRFDLCLVHVTSQLWVFLCGLSPEYIILQMFVESEDLQWYTITG